MLGFASQGRDCGVDLSGDVSSALNDRVLQLSRNYNLRVTRPRGYCDDTYGWAVIPYCLPDLRPTGSP